MKSEFDILIRGGMVLDGSGAPALRADVGVAGDRIAAVGDLARASAPTVLDLSPPSASPPSSTLHPPPSTFFVCPGFIDTHSHSDTFILLEPSAPSKVWQGVTTEVVGNCGASAAPRLGQARLPSDWEALGYPGQWQTVAQYRAVLEQVQPAPNVVLLAGHNTLRGGVVGYDSRAASPEELRAMARALDQAMEEGARGFSTGLVYPPGMFAPREELVELAKVAARHGGVYASHMRNERGRLLEAIDEALAIGRLSGARVQISHLKTAGPEVWSLLDAALEKIRAARREGLAVCADRYPYIAGCTDLDVILPDWVQAGGRDAVLQRLRAPAERARIRAEMAGARAADYWGGVVVGSTSHPENRPFQGRPLPEVARRLGLEPVDAALRLIDTDELKTSAFFFGMSEENLRRIFAEPYVMIGSDASLRSTEGPLSRDYPHPRAFGTFPRVLRMALDGETVPLPEAVRKMTALPAQQFGLSDRGRIAVGMAADLVVMDPAAVRDTASYGEPHRLPEGIREVIVNGVLTLSAGQLSGRRNGRFL